MADTNISWCHKVWNPVTGCTPAGVGCQHCYAKGIAKRFWGDRPFSDVRCHPERLDQPMKWRKPREIFVNSMSDLFHDSVSVGFIYDVWHVMRACPQHTFIVLTKRPRRMRELLSGVIYKHQDQLPNVVLGCSPCNQAEVDRWVPELLATPAACRIVSLEPLVEEVDLTRAVLKHTTDRGPSVSIDTLAGWYGGAKIDERTKLDGVIVGGESGPGARPMRPDWVRSLRDQCAAAGVPFYFKQWGANPHPDAYLEPHGMVDANFYAKNKGRLLDGRTHDALPWR